MIKSGLSLKWLEIFQLISRSGSVQNVASETGLSLSTVSSHLRNLEQNLGVDLVDHSRRPMALTPAGTVFLRYVEEGLQAIKRGETEVRSGNWRQAQDLRFGIIDDFDNEIAPELAQLLASAMPRCKFQHFTRPSHEIIEMLSTNRLDAGVAMRPTHASTDIVERPILRDPFVALVPKNFDGNLQGLLGKDPAFPFLRYSKEHTIGKLIEVHLQRNKINLPNRFELECNQSIICLVAESSGWTITSAASYFRARRFHNRVRVLPLPHKRFARTVSLFTTNVYPKDTSELIATSIRKLVELYFTEPVAKSLPWLRNEFHVLGDQDL